MNNMSLTRVACVSVIASGALLLTACGSAAADVEIAQSEQRVVGGTAKIGVFDNGTWHLDRNDDGVWNNGDGQRSFGMAGDIPLVGKWSGPMDDLGVYRPSTNTFILDSNGNGILESSPTDRWITGFRPANSANRPVVFTYASGIVPGFPSQKTVIGIFINGNWYIDADDNGVFSAANDVQASFGQAGDIPVTGTFASFPTVSVIGVFRPNLAPGQQNWFLDDGDKVWEGCAIDTCGLFGDPTDKPVTNSAFPYVGVKRGVSWYLESSRTPLWSNGDITVASYGAANTIPVRGNWR